MQFFIKYQNYIFDNDSLRIEHFNNYILTELTIFKSEIAQQLIDLYQNDTTKLDLFVGGLLETTDSGPGPLFQRILLDQFMRIRHGDRFWFENKGNG